MESESSNNPRPGSGLVAAAALALVVACLAGFATPDKNSGGIPYLLGTLSAPIILCLIIVGLFSIGKQFRNSRSQTKIVLWTSLVMILSTCAKLAKQISPP